MNKKAPVLAVSHLGVRLRTDQGFVHAVHDVSFTLHASETLALVGESGCGKSMTAMAIMRLLPENAEVTQGEVCLQGKDLLQATEVAMQGVRGARIAMVFQEPGTSLNPVQTIGDQLTEVIRLHETVSLSEAKVRAQKWLTRVGIDKPQARMKAFPHELSGGQKQRVMIAMALCTEPDVVIADEPTTALDVTLQAQVLQLLKTLQQERGIALLLITHDLAIVQQLADRLAVMYAGEIVETAKATLFFSSPKHPYSQRLLTAIPSMEQRGCLLEGIEGVVPVMREAPASCTFATRCRRAQVSCHASHPLLKETVGQHFVRCWNPVEFARERVMEEGHHATQGDVVLDMKDIQVGYEKRQPWWAKKAWTPIVKHVSLRLRKGETLALVGESGSGKTTLGKALLHLLGPQAKVTGHWQWLGREIDVKRPSDRAFVRSHGQMIFQDPFASLDPRMTVGESIAEGMEALGIGANHKERRERVKALLGQVGLPETAIDRLPHEFSGGQRQRIAIARALSVNPAVIVCDEPTSALDVSVQAQILNLLKALQRQTGVALLFITHNFAVVEYLADRVAVMREGIIVETGRAKDVLMSPKHPYTKQLLQAVPRLFGLD